MIDEKINKNEDVEVEKEDLGETVITSPYDPSKIKIDVRTENLGSLIEMLQYNEIDLMPDFQRQGDLWSDTQKSQLIESILLGLPLPSFYFCEDEKTKKWLVVDGLQRLSTFKSFFIDKTLTLTGLEFLGSGYMNKKYDDLSRADHRKISGFKINFYVIDKNTPSDVKFLIFKRVNTGGLTLTPQEIRHALNQGVPAKFIEKLSKFESFKQATNNKISSERQEDRDFVNRFVAFFHLGYDNKYDGELDKFLNEGIALLAEDKMNDEERENIANAFDKAMEVSYQIFEKDAFRKRTNEKDKRNPISKAVFDTISVNIAWLNLDQRQLLLEKKEVFKDQLLNVFGDKKFYDAVTTSTGKKNNVKIRFEKIKSLINEIIQTC